MPIIEVKDVAKRFRIGQTRSLRQALADGYARLKGAPARNRGFYALQDVSFSVEQGEIVGIIGHNGAGKSTVLKLLARISQPTAGSIAVKGRVAPLIEVGAGLVADLTGRENIYLNAAILGMKRADIRRRFDDIVAFAELEQFIDTPLKRYSSGMQVRLGFSIAAAVPAEILIADEVLAVGDIAFQRKCYDRMKEILRNEGRTILLVSHDLREVERMCRRALLLDHGRLVADGDPSEVCGLYFEHINRKIKDQAATHAGRSMQASGEVDLLDLCLEDGADGEPNSLGYDAPFVFRLRLRTHKPLESVIVEMGLQTTDFLKVAASTSEHSLVLHRLEPGVHEIRCRFERMPLMPGIYGVWLIVSHGDPSHGCLWGENLLQVQVSQRNAAIPLVARGSFLELKGAWDASPPPSRRPLLVSSRRERNLAP
jgi:ABC-type polysaccharide/polyol phosphate transport system ATPase subunit